MNGYRHRILVVAVLAILFVGCDPDWPKSSTGCGVTGKVTLDGQAISGVKVIFVPQQLKQNKEETRIALGVTNDMGEFELTVDRSDSKRILHGRYLVMVSKLVDDEELFHESYNLGSSLYIEVDSQEAIQRPLLELESAGTL